MKPDNIQKKHPDFVIYQTDENVAKVSVRLEEETVWLTQKQLAEIFDTTQQNVSQHIESILKDGELTDWANHKKFLLVQTEGVREVKREIDHYIEWSGFSPTSSILPTEKEKRIVVFPNPAKDEIFIKSYSKPNKVEIYSLTGTLIMPENDGSDKISVSNLPQGMYFLKIHFDNETISRKFIKNK